MDTQPKSSTKWIVVIVVAVILLVGITLVVRPRLFDRYAYYPGDNWQSSLEREMCQRYRASDGSWAVDVIYFDWGHYKVYTYGPQPNEQRDIERKGYLGFRAFLKGSDIQPATHPAYIIDPDGVVWRNPSAEAIPVGLTLKEWKADSQGKTGREILLEHFKAKEGWDQYATIELKPGNIMLKRID